MKKQTKRWVTTTLCSLFIFTGISSCETVFHDIDRYILRAKLVVVVAPKQTTIKWVCEKNELSTTLFCLSKIAHPGLHPFLVWSTLAIMPMKDCLRQSFFRIKIRKDFSVDEITQEKTKRDTWKCTATPPVKRLFKGLGKMNYDHTDWIILSTRSKIVKWCRVK